MKAIIVKLLFSGMFSLITFSLLAQKVDCSLFCVSDIRLDAEKPGKLLVSIYNGDLSNSHINYPSIKYILSENGDTLAKGQFNEWYYAHAGHELKAYQVSTSLDALPSGLKATVQLAYTDIFDNYRDLTCDLDFPSGNPGDYCHSKMLNIQVYPNPADTYFTVKFDNPNLINHTLRIFDMQGRLLHTLSGLNTNKKRINRRELPSGVYILRLHRGEELVESRRLILR